MVSSVLQSLTIIMQSANKGIESITLAIYFSSLNAGTTTAIVFCLYIRTILAN